MVKTLTGLALITAVCLASACGGGAANTNKANTPTNANKPAATPSPASSPAASNSDAADKGSNEELDFTLVNKTGYAIKKVLVGPTSTKEWSDDMEILKGRTFADGANMDIKFHSKLTAAKWDLKVEWADGSGSEEWLDLDLTKIEKLTLHYDKATDKTTAEIAP
jgi:hypothetical protein